MEITHELIPIKGEDSLLPKPPITHMHIIDIVKCEENDTVGLLFEHDFTPMYMYLILLRGRDHGVGGSKNKNFLQEKMLAKMNEVKPAY